MLRPGGTVLFAGRAVALRRPPGRVPQARGGRGWRPLWRRALRASAAPAGHADGGATTTTLEALVDVHAFTPGELAGFARARGLRATCASRGEELLANWFGWTNRTLEATADPRSVP